MDRLKTMEAFVRVVEAGSFTAAAEALGMSRPMVSKHIQELEARLGVQLLNRTTRRISLTEAGRLFHMRCEAIFGQIDEAVAEAGNQQVEPRGLLRINAPVTFGRLHLSRTIAEFQSLFPNVSVNLTLNDRTVDIVDEGFDAAIRVTNLQDSSLIARFLAPCRMILCAAPSYIERYGTPEQPEDLRNHNCLIYTYFSQQKRWQFQAHSETSAPTSKPVEKLSEANIGVDVNGDFQANFGEALVEAALAGRGIIVEPSFTVSPYLRAGTLVSFMPRFTPRPLGIYAVYPPARLLPRKTRAFIDHCRRTFSPEPYWD